MSIAHQITLAKRHHKPVSELRRKQVAQVCERLEHEMATANTINAVIVAISDLVNITGHDEAAYQQVKADKDTLTLAHSRLGRLLEVMR